MSSSRVLQWGCDKYRQEIGKNYRPEVAGISATFRIWRERLPWRVLLVQGQQVPRSFMRLAAGIMQ